MYYKMFRGKEKEGSAGSAEEPNNPSTPTKPLGSAGSSRDPLLGSCVAMAASATPSSRQ